MKKDRRFAHGEHTSLRAGGMGKMRTIADGKDVRVGFTLQRGQNLDVALLHREADVGEPLISTRSCRT